MSLIEQPLFPWPLLPAAPFCEVGLGRQTADPKGSYTILTSPPLSAQLLAAPPFSFASFYKVILLLPLPAAPFCEGAWQIEPKGS